MDKNGEVNVYISEEVQLTSTEKLDVERSVVSVIIKDWKEVIDESEAPVVFRRVRFLELSRARNDPV